jgi:eukaryotic-like serine/threonine-protein kinase
MPALSRPVAPPARPPVARDRPSVPGYALVQHLATGNWFEVHRARPLMDGEASAADYAIKTIRPGIADRDFARAMLEREATVAASVWHPNLIALLDAEISGSNPFLVFPFVPGLTLARLVAGARKTAVPQALWFCRQIAAALAALHAGGWLHGDVKPQNIVVSEQGHVTLLDLGLARRLDSAECNTETWLAGDAAFLAPEAMIPGRQLTAASDIYALGLTLISLLEGEADVKHTASVDRWESISRLRAHRPDVSREVATLIAKSMALEPLRRPTAAELVTMLTRLEIDSLMQW